MDGTVGRGARVDAQRVDAEPGGAALDEQRRGVAAEAGERERLPEVLPGVVAVGVPAGAEEHGGAGGHAAVRRLPGLDVGGAQHPGGIAAAQGAGVDPDRRADELLGGDVGDRRRPGDAVARRV